MSSIIPETAAPYATSQQRANRVYYYKNRATILQNQKDYYERNREIVKQKRRERYKKKKEAARLTTAESRLAT